MKRKALAAALIVSAGLWSASSLAQVTCTVSSSSVAFGVYEPLTGSNLDSTGTIELECERSFLDGQQGDVGLTVTLGAGGNGLFIPRAMSSGNGVLEYNLYTAASRNVVWGDGAGGTVSRNASISLPLFTLSGETSLTIYGEIPGGQFVPAGSYSDMITVTVTY